MDSLIMGELVKARFNLQPYPAGGWNNSIMWSKLMQEVLADKNSPEMRNKVMLMIHKLECLYLNEELGKITDAKVRLCMHSVFGLMNDDVGGLRTYALDSSILPAQLLKSQVPQLGIPKYDDDDDEDYEEDVEFAVQNVRKASKFLKAGSLDTVDVYTPRENIKTAQVPTQTVVPHSNPGNSSCSGQTFRRPSTTVINSQQMAFLYSEATSHLDSDTRGRLLCQMPPDSLAFGNIALMPPADRQIIVSTLISMDDNANVGPYIQRAGSPKYFVSSYP